MKITGLKTYLISVPCGKLISDSARRLDRIQLIVVETHTSSGIYGTGFTYTLRGGEGVKAVVDSELGRLVKGRDPTEIEKIWCDMCRATDARTHGGLSTNAIAAVDISLWDIVGKEQGLPLYRLLGDKRNKIPIYDTDSGWLHYRPGELAENAVELVKRGFKGFKIKVGKKTLEEDLERIRAVRDAVGDDLKLMVDANQAFEVDEAIRRGKAYERYDVYWFEEPIVGEYVEDYSKIKSALDMYVATGEWIYHLDTFEKLIRRDAVDIVQPDVCRVKGVTEWVKIAELAKECGVLLAPHFVMDIHVHLACAFPNGLMIEHMGWLTPLLKRALAIEDGYAIAPETGGHGVEFNEKVLGSLLDGT
ncbi:MAG: mandelate racemase/muconate lactonizing enzyme family protein [Nitrososphaeria archaeon]